MTEPLTRDGLDRLAKRWPMPPKISEDVQRRELDPVVIISRLIATARDAMDRAEKAERDLAWNKVCSAAIADRDGWVARAEQAEARAEAAEAECKRLRDALNKFAIHGIPRIDHEPTHIYDPDNRLQMASENWWRNYFRIANENVRKDARAALNAKEPSDG